MRKKLVKYIIDNDLKIGFMIDESSTRSKKETLVICLRCELLDSMDASSYFFDIVELQNTTVATIRDAFPNNLQSNGFDNNF
jgi:hypothetical protein